MALGCGKEREKERPKEKQGRDRLLHFDGLTSMHEHVDSERGAEILLESMEKAGIAHTLLLGAYETLLHGATPDFDSAAKNNELLFKLIEAHPDNLSMFVMMDGRESDPVAALKASLARGRGESRCTTASPPPIGPWPSTHLRSSPCFGFAISTGFPCSST